MGVQSAQILHEFYVTLTRKIPKTLDRSVVRRLIRNYSQWDVVVNDPDIILLASEIEDSHRISFWDALIISAAFTQNAGTIRTEDLSHGQYLEGVLIKNPFI